MPRSRWQMTVAWGLEAEFSVLTPASLLASPPKDRPFVIRPLEFPTFESLLGVRDMVRLLRLLPVKQQDEYDRYAEDRASGIATPPELAPGEVALLKNRYSYWLPQDTVQYVLWWGQGTSRDTVLSVLEGRLSASGVGLDRVVSFERSPVATSPLVRGTMREFPHMHVWVGSELVDG